MLRILELVHDRDFPEKPSNLDIWVNAQKVNAQKDITTKRFYCYLDQKYPEMTSFDLLIIHGGDQHLWNKKQDPWLFDEIDFVKKVMGTGKPIIGFCLGGQIIAEACGGDVFLHEPGEFGFFEVSPYADKSDHLILNGLSNGFVGFEWHSDHFRLPNEVESLAYTTSVPNQIFLSSQYPVVGFQFHPEFTLEMIKEFVALEKEKRWHVIEGTQLSTSDFLEYLESVPETYTLFETVFDNVIRYLKQRGYFESLD